MAKGIGPLLLLGGAVALMMAKKKSSSGTALGVSVDSDCFSIDIFDEESLFVHMWDIYTKERAKGIDDPFKIANSIIDSVSPKCGKFPDDLSSPDQLDLYARAVKFSTIELSKEYGVSISDLLHHPLANEYAKWLEEQKQRLIFLEPEDGSILVIEDGERILVGERWVMDVFMPTMQSIPSIIFTQGTAPAMAGAILEKTVFINQDGESIGVDLEKSELGKQLVDVVTKIAKAYVEAAGGDADATPTIGQIANHLDFYCPAASSISEMQTPACTIAQQFGRFE